MTNLPATRATNVDPKKWYLSPETGEYHRITGYHKGQVFIDQTTYAQRIAADYGHTKHRRQIYISWVILAFVCVFGYEGFIVHKGGDWINLLALFALILGPLLFLATSFAAVGAFIGSFKDIIGPPPIPVPGREQVEEQKVHGDGRFMTREEIDQAASGETAFPASPQEFED